ncbi:MAG: hypothetical protein JRD89_09860 [Deltaproteobacteria bacterium]|nr:hypothetical protein [Deltaproteobacteria bacterium]
MPSDPDSDTPTMGRLSSITSSIATAASKVRYTMASAKERAEAAKRRYESLRKRYERARKTYRRYKRTYRRISKKLKGDYKKFEKLTRGRERWRPEYAMRPEPKEPAFVRQQQRLMVGKGWPKTELSRFVSLSEPIQQRHLKNLNEFLRSEETRLHRMKEAHEREWARYQEIRMSAIRAEQIERHLKETMAAKGYKSVRGAWIKTKPPVSSGKKEPDSILKLTGMSKERLAKWGLSSERELRAEILNWKWTQTFKEPIVRAKTPEEQQKILQTLRFRTLPEWRPYITEESYRAVESGLEKGIMAIQAHIKQRSAARLQEELSKRAKPLESFKKGILEDKTLASWQETTPFIRSYVADEGLKIIQRPPLPKADPLRTVAGVYTAAETAASRYIKERTPEPDSPVTRAAFQAAVYTSPVTGPLAISSPAARDIAVETLIGSYGGLRERPIQTAALTAISFALPSVIGAAKPAGGAVASAISRVPRVGPPIAKYGARAAWTGLSALYGASTVHRVAKEPTIAAKSRKVGEILSTEVAPAFIGTYAGLKYAPRLPSIFQTAGKKEIPIEKIGYPALPEGGYPIAGRRISAKELMKSFKHGTLYPRPVRLEPSGVPVKYLPKRAKLPGEPPGDYMWTGWEELPEFDDELVLGRGDSELPGMYGAPVAETYFTHPPLGPRISLFSTEIPSAEFRLPVVLRTRVSKFKPVPRSVRERGVGAIAEYVRKGVWREPGTAYLPLMKPEYEAVLPEKTVLKSKGVRFFTKSGPHRFPIHEFVVSPMEGGADTGRIDKLSDLGIGESAPAGEIIRAWKQEYRGYGRESKAPIVNPISLIASGKTRKPGRLIEPSEYIGYEPEYTPVYPVYREQHRETWHHREHPRHLGHRRDIIFHGISIASPPTHPDMYIIHHGMPPHISHHSIRHTARCLPGYPVGGNC